MPEPQDIKGKLDASKFNGELAVDLQQVTFAYRRGQGVVLSVDAWQLARGDRAFIYGSSGSGKSTLLSLLAGLVVPVHGSVQVMGQPISQFNGAKRDRFRAQHIGVIFQQFNLIPWLTVQDNIAAACYFSANKKLNRVTVAKRTTELMNGLGLPLSLLKRKTRDLSIGQQQRVAIARALVNKPELIIADEPTSALDTEARDGFMQLLLQSISDYASTLIFVSHDKSLAKEFSKIVDLASLNSAAKAGSDAQ